VSTIIHLGAKLIGARADVVTIEAPESRGPISHAAPPDRRRSGRERGTAKIRTCARGRPECGAGFDRSGLQPVHADRFLVAHLVPGKRMSRNRRFRPSAWSLARTAPRRGRWRDVEESRAEQQQAAQARGRRRRGHGARDKIKPRRHSRACRIHPVFRLAAALQTGGGHRSRPMVFAYAETAIRTTG